jgi:formate dehydrogenase subunit delta
MTDDKLAYMANQIATAFRAQPRDAAAAAVADHINKFWEPRMRARLFERLDAGGPGLDPVVVAAAPSIRRPAPADL